LLDFRGGGPGSIADQTKWQFFFVVKVVLELLFVQVIQFPVSVIPPSFFPHLHLNMTHIRRTSGLNQEDFKQNNAVSYVGENGTEGYVHIFFHFSVS
jgi:hypothetical protein